MKQNWKIEVINPCSKWKEYKSERQWKRLKSLARAHAYEVFLWDIDNNKILDGVC